MTLRAILGLLALNAFVLGVGIGVLFGIRGWLPWRELARLAGLAYLLGVATLFVILTAELVAGIALRPETVLATSAAIVLAGLVCARWRSARVRGVCVTPPAVGPSLVAALFVAAAAVYYGALFRAARLSDLGWDVWGSWVPKSKALYFFGEVDPEFFASLPGGAYPPGLPILNALAFHAMGSADAVTLHLQYWFYAVGFAAAVVGLLSGRVRPLLLYPFLLLVLVMPDLRNRATDLYGDAPLGYLVALAALIVLLWIEDRASWRMVAFTVLLAGAMLTKREGVLFGACIISGALVATVRDRGHAWPRLLLAGGTAVALSMPWRAWFLAHDLPSDGPEAGYLGVFSHLDRAWPSHRLVLQTLFEYDLWLLAPTMTVAAIALAYLAGARTEPTYTLVLFVTFVVGSAWTFWSNPSLDLGTEEGLVNRVVGTPVLALAVLVPVLLQRAWDGKLTPGLPEPRLAIPARGRALVAAVVVCSVGVIYAASALGGEVRFPGRENCVVAPVPGQKARVVYGYRGTYPEAVALRDRALEVGFAGTDIAQDGCGRLRVLLDDVPSIEIAEGVVQEARTVGLDATVELDADD